MVVWSCNPRTRETDPWWLLQLESQLSHMTGRSSSLVRDTFSNKEGGLYLRNDTQSCPLASSLSSVFVCECVHMGVMHICVFRLEFFIRVLPPSLSVLFFEISCEVEVLLFHSCPNTGIADACSCVCFLACVPRIQTQVLIIVWQALHYLDHLLCPRCNF